MTENDINEDYLDDPIRLFDSEQNRVCFHLTRKEVIIEDDDVDETGIKEPEIEDEETLFLYESNSSILPITFFDIDSNVELLKQCRPLSIKLVDCDKYPWCFKNKPVLTENNNPNLDKIVLEEVDCIEILSPDDPNDNENCDIILRRNTLDDISNINKELDKMCFESEKKSMENKGFDEMETYEEYKRSSLNNTKNINLKKNKGLIGFKIPQTNFINDSKSDRRKIKSHIYDSSKFEESYIDKFNTYARLIDKAHQKLKNVDNPRPIDEDSLEYPEKDQNKNKTKRSKNLETTELNIREKNLNDSINVKNRDVNYELLFSKLSQSKNGTATQMFLKNNKDLLISVKSSSKSENLVLEKSKATNVIMEEPQSKGITLDNNNGSSSPLLPCPSQSNKSMNPKKVTIISDTPLISYSKPNLKNNSVCKNHFFSADRVIPHYHNESMQTKKQYLSSKLPRSILIKPIENNELNKCNYNYKSVLKECINDVNVNDINNFPNNTLSKSNTNQLPPSNRSIPIFYKQECISYSNLSQKFIENKINVNKERARQLDVNMAIQQLDDTKRRNHPVNAVSNIPVILSRKPQCTLQNNVSPQTFPIQRIVSNRDTNLHTNNFIVTPDHPSIISTIHQNMQNITNNIYSNHMNNNLHTPVNNLCSGTPLQTLVNVNGQRSSTFNAISQQPLSTLNCLPQHQANHYQLPDINVKHHINNYKCSISVEDNTKHRTSRNKSNTNGSYVNQEIGRTLENYKNSERKARAYVNKYSHLKQILEQPPLKMSKPDAKNKTTGQRMCQNNNGMKIKSQNYIINTINIENANKNSTLQNNRNTSNVNKEAMVVAFLATDYINQKESRVEENIKYKSDKEESLNNPRLIQLLNQFPVKMSTTQPKNTESNQNVDQNNIISVKTISKGYSPPILPIPTYHKTFETLADNIIGVSVSPQNVRKRKTDEAKHTSRKITLSEYKKRKSAIETINIED